MEQKKILWVIISVTLFILIIVGTALFLYSPARSKNSAIATDLSKYTNDTQAYNQAGIDPNMWAREPDKIPEFGNAPAQLSGNTMNMLIVPSPESKQDIDVSDLTNSEENLGEKTNSLPPELAEQIGLNATPEKKEDKEVKAAKEQEPPAKKTVAKAEQKTESTPQVKKTSSQQVSSAKTQPKALAKAPQKLSSKSKTQAASTNSPSKSEMLFWVQTASLSSKINAERARDRLAEKHMKVEIFTKETLTGVTHRVRVGPFANKTEAEYWLKNIKTIDGFNGSYISQEKVKR
ncbi:MAG: SPOR domain-containing protein [Treponema phagedenis]|uniref:SPOR domain-containing protein n=1 Tax=Treponema phagedenis TaxID=162 RepID=UPI003133D3D2